ncbi:hypothetical protein JQC92_11080 [Shewanella sp. 202IG2-18]|uniref:hypothetical protein n=1 Tax=Parashewanella hymeniacidonis TaxID=2807618 RepID=UPI001960ED97|nr:hypothetical protein [Parashewanella hymeniacidonis]MBM7072567.1 hypothetical protein [Parashewanella hymeniacidonis]
MRAQQQHAVADHLRVRVDSVHRSLASPPALNIPLLELFTGAYSMYLNQKQYFLLPSYGEKVHSLETQNRYFEIASV